MLHHTNDIYLRAESIAKKEADAYYANTGNAGEWFKILDEVYRNTLIELAAPAAKAS